MEPAKSIIDRLGGSAAVSKATGAHRTRVWKWTQPKHKGGTGGFIPLRHIQTLMRFAQDKGIILTANDFLPFAPSGQAKNDA